MRWLGVLVAPALAALASGCGGQHEIVLPAPESAPAPVLGPGLYAGFGRADLTPPPGVGMTGYGPDSPQSIGWRHRLFARALVLDDGKGGRLALVVADLTHISPTLHRLAAQRLRASGSPIGADHLILSATHTHAGPGNYYEVEQYNAQAGRFSGYDEAMVDFLVDGIVRAVGAAEANLAPAVAGWRDGLVEGFSWNRSMRAYGRNVPDPDFDTLGRLDRRWSVLRIDRCASGWRDCRPAGAFSVFAIHGTSYPPANALLDGDVHALVERGLEETILRQNPTLTGCDGTPVPATGRCDFLAKAFHLFANGTEGDASPISAMPTKGTRCLELMRFLQGTRPGGPRTPPAPEAWHADSDAVRACLARAADSTKALGDAMSVAVAMIYGRDAPLHRDLDLAVAFRTLDLRTLTGPDALCDRGPRTGTANIGGSEDGPTRFRGWKVGWIISLGFDEEGGGVRSPRDCQGAKSGLLEPLQGWILQEHGLPHLAQIAVVRIGDRLLAAVPAEVTTTAGRRMRRAVSAAYASAVGPAGDSIPLSHVMVMSLTNGFMQYITTPEEYTAQEYEGGSNLWGPHTVVVFAEELARLAESLPGRPIVEVDSMVVGPGATTVRFPPRAGPSGGERKIEELTCRGRVVRVTWIDAPPGRLAIAGEAVIRFERRVAGAWRTMAWDDQHEVTVFVEQSVKDGYRWAAEWSPRDLQAGEYRVVLPARPDASLARVESSSQTCPAAD